MKEIMYVRNRINPAKISGPYSLLAVMLLVAEFLFALWFYKAQSSLERSIAGAIIAAVFISLMLLVMKMNQTPANKKPKLCHSYKSEFKVNILCSDILQVLYVNCYALRLD